MAVSKDQKTGKWQAQVWYVDWQGLRKRKHKRGFDTKKAAQAWEREFLGQEHGQTISMDSLIAAFKKDMEEQQELGNLKASTVHNKKNFIARYIEPYFKQKDVSTITGKDVNTWIATINKKNHYNDRMSSGTLNVTRNMLSQIFEYGIKHYGLQKNPVKSSEVVKPFTNDRRAKLWSLEQYNTFYDSLHEPRHRVIFNILFWSGLRIGELLALTPGDIHGNTITVNKTITSSSNGGHAFTGPKTSSSNREVAIPERLAVQIAGYISQLQPIQDTDRIFDIDDSTVRAFLRYRCEKLGLPKISPHILRHSYTSIMLQQTHDVAMVSYQIGHASPQTTLAVYSHMVPGANTEQVKLIENMVKI